MPAFLMDFRFQPCYNQTRMPKRNNKELTQDLNKSVFAIQVAGDSYFKPYIELFEFSGENVIQDQLGKILGFFEIVEYSDYSAYIVNFLTSVLKKEYFANPKRPAVESFESSLNKVNIALSELAKQENINWIGKLNSAVCVLERNNIHLSTTGNAKVLLFRNGMLNDISEELSPEESEPHPLKTFINVSGGRVEDNDKFIITTNELFQIFSLNEIKKGALRFSSDKFVQFIKTAMVNELDIAATIIVDVTKPEEVRIEENKKPQKKEKLNAFSQLTFKKKKREDKTAGEIAKDSGKTEYVDSKTGHIYMQGENEYSESGSAWKNELNEAREKISDFAFWIKKDFAKKITSDAKKISKTLWIVLVNFYYLIIQRIKSRGNKIQEESIEKEKSVIFETDLKEENSTKELPISPKNYFAAVSLEGLKSFFRDIIPSFAKIKTKFDNLNYQQRIYAILAVFAIIVVPLVWIKVSGKKEKPAIVQEKPVISDPKQIYGNEKNIIFDKPITAVFAATAEAIPVISDGQIILVESQKTKKIKDSGESSEFPLPENSGKLKGASLMKDLNIVLIYAESGKILSFNITTEKFQDNKIDSQEGMKISRMGTYLTYLYLLDSQNNKIYRYPRAEGGFGNKVDWLKEDIDLKNVSGMAIDENIYLADGGKIIKLFRGKKQEFNPEQSATPIRFNKIFTNTDTDNIYILDNPNGRVIKFGKNGEIISQYYNDKLKNALEFAVDEKNNKAYFTTSSELDAIEL